MPSNISKKSKIFPTISFIIPTLNSARVLSACLESIRKQNYSSFQILIIDGGSTDNTLKIAKKYHCQILNNPLKTAEAGKAIGVKNATTDFVALIDSDNILPSKNWLSKMMIPFTDPLIIGSEPWAYTYRPQAGLVERYSALTGVNDPYTLVAKNYDRLGSLHPSWTGLPVSIVNHHNYQTVVFKHGQPLPTIGANGTIFRTGFLKEFTGNYLFDIDVISLALKPKKIIYFAKVKIGIIHTFCESSISKFFRKQFRRANDLYIYKSLRNYYLTKNNTWTTVKWIFYVTLIFPMLYDTLKGYFKKPDLAWFFHPLACLITSYCYGLVTIKYKFGLLTPLDRQQWQQ